MNSSASGKRLYILVGIFLFLIFLGFYDYLGGFNRQVEVRLVAKGAYVVAGTYFEGNYDDDTLRHLFDEARSYLDQKQLDGLLAVVNFNESETKKGQIKQLIGVATEQQAMAVPKNLSVDTFRASQVVRAVVCAHPLVMPKPESVNEEIRSYAKEKGFELADYTIEQYISEEEIWIDAPVIKK